MEWGDISVAKEDKDMFRLYVSKNKAIILLKRFFDSNDQKNVFKTLIKKNLESKKIKLRSG
ncbi:YcxB family protein [Bacillus marinisedimentorum]|uniref:YcxB family protein n=1 Tax=Bacillus marinisedimentorum TaxID=1821260 RepID=UPI0009F71702